MTQYKIRDSNPDDIPFIYSTWLKSYRYDSDVGTACRNNTFFVEYREIIDRILDLENTQVVVACDPTEESVIYGYLVAETSTLHYCYVKESFRKLGVASAMKRAYTQDIGCFTHKTKSVLPILDKHPELVYNPFILYKKGNDT